MNKSELIDAISSNIDVPKSTAKDIVDAFLESVTEALKQGDSVSLVGFGTFAVKERPAREGRNPQTGAAMQIAASRLPSFKAGKNLKESLNSK